MSDRITVSFRVEGPLPRLDDYYYKRRPGNLLTSELRYELTRAQWGIYNDLMDLIYLHRGEVSGSGKYLMSVLLADESDLAAVLATKHVYRVAGDRIRHRVCDEVLDDLDSAREVGEELADRSREVRESALLKRAEKIKPDLAAGLSVPEICQKRKLSRATVYRLIERLKRNDERDAQRDAHETETGRVSQSHKRDAGHPQLINQRLTERHRGQTRAHAVSAARGTPLGAGAPPRSADLPERPPDLDLPPGPPPEPGMVWREDMHDWIRPAPCPPEIRKQLGLPPLEKTR